MIEQRKPDAPANSPLSSTRQLLDELDALMQRMLSLPVGDTAAEARSNTVPATSVLESPPVKAVSASVPPVRTMPKPPAPAPRTPTYSYEQPVTPEKEEPPAEPEATEEQPPAEPETDEEAGNAQDEASALPFSPGRINTVSTKALASLTSLGSTLANEPVFQRSRLLAAGAARRNPWWSWPLRLINGAFNLFTYLLGPLGAWLRQPSGRTFLGWLGVALLLAAVGLQVALWVAW